MPRQFTLPDLGEGLEEAEIVAWLVNEGDHVVANQPLVVCGDRQSRCGDSFSVERNHRAAVRRKG